LFGRNAHVKIEEVLNNYFKELDKVFKAYNLHEGIDYFWNIDETGLQMEHSPRKILCMQGKKTNTVTSINVQAVTIIECGSAAGTHFPPYYKESWEVAEPLQCCSNIRKGMQGSYGTEFGIFVKKANINPMN
ncbi:hypothetical protein MAR_027730, partial [Mya arenaria]